ncbi:MAG: Rne/Rng family ribonuclease [Deltaproteobacteria bacterium]|nr:Rne/Rng family ribonuclease [Deltaproteobacteria bacterium]
MYKELIINDSGFETRVALLEDGVLTELYVEREGEADLVGNIYKARVLRVLPGMQAAFVDIGLRQAAFIYVDDVVAGFPPDPDSAVFGQLEEEAGEEEGEWVEEEGRTRPPARKKAPIEDLLREGQEILVQVAKSPMGTKGARVTSRVTIPGRLLVLMPTTTHVGLSRRIEDAAERARLKEALTAAIKEPYGYIVRTAAEGVGADKLAQEVDFLNRLWKRVLERFRRSGAPGLLHMELSATLRACRDLFTHEVDRLVIDSLSGYREIREFVEAYMPHLVDAVEFYDDPKPIFDAYHLEVEISRLAKKKVWLKSGGYIVIEDTEALVSVDVNTGRYVGKGDLSETILKTNLEAVREIAYQLRLRDLGGIIVIDFIDMEKEEDRDKVYQALINALTRDRSTTNVQPMSEMGLIEMTRKRTRENIMRLLTETCPCCEGEGRVLSKKSMAHNIYREILRRAQGVESGRLAVRVHPDMARYLLEEENTNLLWLEKRVGKEIHIQADNGLSQEIFDIAGALGE